MMRRGTFILALSIITFLFSCGKDEFSYEDKDMVLHKDEGTIELSVKTSDEIVTKSGLNVNDFTVEIFNSAGVKIKKWNKFSDISGQKVRLNVGTFTVKAYYGDSNATGFDAVYFAGETNFTVSRQTSKAISVVCKQANVQLKVVWGSRMPETYSDYTLKAVKTGGTDTLTFTKNEIRQGYLPAGTIILKLNLISGDGTERVYYPEPITCAANDLMTLTINAQEAATYQIDFSFSIDSSTENKVIDVTIPAVLKGKDSPALSSDNFGASNLISFVEGVQSAARVDINAPGYIQKCLLTIDSEYLKSKGWPSEVDLVSIDANTAVLLKQYGLSWLENMENQKLSYIDFSNVTANIYYINGATDNIFKIKITDAYNQSAEQTYTLQSSAAAVSIANIEDYNVWAKRVILEMSTANGDVNKLMLEQYDGSDWNDIECTVVSKTATSVKVEVAANSNTAYSFRARYNNTVSNAVSCTTEAATQIENSGFETWTNSTVTIPIKLVFSYGDFTQNVYYPYSSESSKWWDVNSKATLPSQITPSNENFKAFPTVSYTGAGRNGKAAQIMAVAVNNGNTSVTSLSNAVAGELFIGSYSGNATGHSFTARPATMQFYYKYTPKGGNDTFEAYIELRNGSTVIGSGTFTKAVSSSAPVSDWTLGEVSVNYTNTKLKATAIYVRFKSSTASKPPYSVNTSVTLPAGSKNCHGGSILLIDDLNLVY